MLKEKVTQAFQNQFGAAPEFIIRAPGRVNLIGEHTDYNDGFVLPMAINRAVWMAIRPRTDRRVIAHSLELDTVTDFSLDQIDHKPGEWSEYVHGVAAILQKHGYDLKGWEGVLSSDVPVGAGLSSSAALEIATAKAFSIVSGWPFDPATMAKIGQETENEWVGANTGIMDQMISASGQDGHALMIDCRDLSTRQILIPAGTAIIVMDTATRHTHTDSGYNERREQCEAAAAYFGVSHLRDVSIEQFLAGADGLEDVTRRRARHVITENDRVLQAAEVMAKGDATQMGRLMDASHVSMRDDFEITNNELNVIVRLAQAQSGCYGARMTGGGFGGCAVALVDQAAAGPFAEAVTAAYTAETGLTPQIYICQATDGAQQVE